MRDLHSIGYIHNDIKLDNILVDPKQETSTVYLIDFGLSKPFMEMDSETGGLKHIDQKQLKMFTGNFMFASVNSIRGFSKSRRDDMESAFYLIIYLLNKNQLPWTYLCPTNNIPFKVKASTRLGPSMQQDFEDIFLDCKFISLHFWFSHLLFINKCVIIARLTDIYNYIKSLGFKVKPNYDFVIGKLQEMLDSVKFRRYCFDWENFPIPRQRCNSLSKLPHSTNKNNNNNSPNSTSLFILKSMNTLNPEMKELKLFPYKEQQTTKSFVRKEST